MRDTKIEPLLVSYLLEKGDISLPASLMKYEAIIEIEKALRKGDPLLLSKTFERFSKNIDRYFLKDGTIYRFLNQIRKFKRNYFLISQDDEKILNYLIKLEKFQWRFLLETIGPLYFILKTFQELEKTQKISKIIKTFVIIYAYIVLYETILHEIDRRLYLNLKSKEHKNKEWYKKFFDKVKRKKYQEHATARLINEIFSDVLRIPINNESIFGGKAETKIFRNKIAHANVFYDEDREEIVIVGKRYKLNDFLKLFYRLLSFLIRWIEKTIETEVENIDSFKNKIILDLRKSLDNLSRLFLKIQRSGELKLRFTNLVISWKKEVGL